MQWIFKSAVAIFCGAMLAPLSATASSWAPFEQRETGDRVEWFEWNSESLAVDAGAPQSVSATWRRYTTTQMTPRPETQEIAKSQIDCQRFGLSTFHRERLLVRKDGSLGMRLGPPIESSRTDNPSSWATWGSSDGKLIRTVCQAAFPEWMPEFLVAHERECGGKVEGMCSPEKRDLAYAVSLLLYRKYQADEVCTAGQDVQAKSDFSKLADQAVDDVLAEVTRCPDGACQLTALNWMLAGIGSDLVRAGQGLRCQAFEQRAERIAQEKRRAVGVETMKAYLACAVRKAPALDDGLSAAESVATALHSACLDVFNSAADLLVRHPDSREILARQFQPKLVEIVLQYRAAQRVPKKTVPRPDTSRRIQS
ncbi:hypothetical protein GPA27_19485 [Aromatoleum toluolicum]|uniref:Secreted protein n=1 Tax=Aromatoleum toluolicum TaxID=90060 RepID=A0ABX1NJR1_9RHOO|nr:hypothetical protein [Aromatoleum toluolicum]NMF99564.1 hypothetical protein [Aromatoleum toluolicum]